MDEDEFNDFEEAQPPAPTSTAEPSQVIPDLTWNIAAEGTSMVQQNEGGDIGSTLQTGSGSFGFAFDLESPLQVDSVQPQMAKIGSVYDLTNTTIIPPFMKQNSLQLTISSTDLFDFNSAIQPQIENQQLQTSEIPSFSPASDFEKPPIQQSRFMFQFEPMPNSNPMNVVVQNSSNGQYSLDLFDWGKTQILQTQQQKPIQIKEIVKADEEEQFDFSESSPPALVVNEQIKMEVNISKQQIIVQYKKQEEQHFQFTQPQVLDKSPQEVQVLQEQPTIKVQDNGLFSQFQSNKVYEQNPIAFSIENFTYSQPVITKLQEPQIRKQSDEFQFVTAQPRIQQQRKQSQDFQFQEETPKIHQLQAPQKIQQSGFNIQNKFQQIHSAPLTNFYEDPKPQAKNQTINVQAAIADNEQQDEFGDFQEPPSHEQPSTPYIQAQLPSSAPIQPVEIKKEFSDSYQRDFYKEKKEHLDKFVANLPDYSFLFTRGFLN